MNETPSDMAYQMALCYYRGKNGYPLDHDKAFRFASAAAKVGNDEAMHLLGVLYKNGEGTEQNYNSAIAWFLKAIETNENNGFALFDLGRMYFLGKGVSQNDDIAFDYLDRAIELALGNTKPYFSKACYYAGYILLTKEKFEDAVRCFASAVKFENIAEAWYFLGWLAEKGYPKEEFSKPNTSMLTRDAQAYVFYEQAAKLGHIESMFKAGVCMIAFEEERSCYWLEEAARHGHKDAEKRLKAVRAYWRNRKGY